MRRYAQAEEESIRAQALVREWTRSRLLDPSQGAGLEAELRVDVKRTNGFLRAGLALFTGLIVGASVMFIIVGLDLKDETPLAVVFGVAALACIGLAEVLTGRFRFYRFGVEEALAVAAVLLLTLSAAELASGVPNDLSGRLPRILGLLVGAAGAFGLYRRFGFVYAAVGSAVCAASIPFQLDLSVTTRHLLAAATLAAVFFVVRTKRLRYQDEYPGDEYGQLQAAMWAGLYVTMNLQLTSEGTLGWFYSGERIHGWFYWCTYAMTWVLPLVGLRLGIREKDRALMDVSLVMAFVTLLTNKPYLGWPRRTWDPILLGLLLMAVALALRRWLSKGPDGERDGFTSARLLGKDSAVLTLLSAASAAFQPVVPVSGPPPAKPDFGGGRSGGGGGGDSY
jgi:hypothetical protein